MIRFNLLDITSIMQLVRNRGLLLFGTGKDSEDCRNKLQAAGLRVTAFLDYRENAVPFENVVTLDSIRKQKDRYYVLLTEEKGKTTQAEILLTAGLAYIRDFNYLDSAHAQTKIGQQAALDPTMGHGTYSGENAEACRFFGDFLKAKHKIAVNGASLADETFFDWKLWPQLMYEKLTAGGEPVSFALHATYGYTTGQCFLKFIRDILPQKPEILIDYCSWENDCYYGEQIGPPYVVGYQKKEMAVLLGKIRAQYGTSMADCIQTGRTVPEKTADAIAKHILMTKKLCDDAGIRYFCVLPPSIVTKKKNCVAEDEKAFSLGKQFLLTGKICAEAKAVFAPRLGDSLIDAGSWVDNERSIFFDQFHMYEDGNKIIANRLLEVLRERGCLDEN